MDALQGLNNLIEECIKEGCFPGANYCLVIKDGLGAIKSNFKKKK